MKFRGRNAHPHRTVKPPLMTGRLSWDGIKVTYLKLGWSVRRAGFRQVLLERLAFHDAAMQGGNRRLRAVADVEAGENCVHVPLHGAFGDAERASDLPVA